MCVSELLYLVFCYWALSLFPGFGYCKYSSSERFLMAVVWFGGSVCAIGDRCVWCEAGFNECME